MNNFKIGDKVKSKCGQYEGYVSHVDKGQLFEKKIYDINVHLGGRVHVNLPATEWIKIV